MFNADLDKFKCAEFRREFVSYMYEGENLLEACARMKVNPAALGIARRDMPEFDAEIKAAQAFRIEVLTDRLENIQEYESDAIMAGVISKNIQWLASKRYRQVYGDKVDVNHNVTVNIKDAIQAARERTLQYASANVLEDNTNATDNISAAQVIDAEFATVEDVDPLS